MFQDCSSLTELDLSGLVNNEKVYEMQDMFNGCTNLKTVILNNPEFKTRASTGTTAGSVQMQRMFTGCTSLNKVDFSNITVYGRSNWTQFKEMFKNNTSLEEIHLKNTKVPHCTDFTSMFEGCSNLQTVDLENFTPSDAVYMTNMFKDCTSLVNLDVSSFGMLLHIVNMDGFVEGDTSLKILNISNLDNSNIGPTNTRHSITESEAQLKGAQEYGRMLGLHTCTALETLDARNSKVWMVHNNKGLPGNEYFDAANESNIYYFTDKAMEFKSDTGPTVTIASDRDYIDIMTDRDGTVVNTPILNGPSDIGDRATNINIVNGDLNAHGPGYLAPGVYTLSGSRSDSEGATMPDTYYRIAYLHQSDFEIEGVDTFTDLVLTEGATTKVVNTKNISWPESGNVTMTGNMSITFKDAAIDVNGKLHDVKVNITSITFKDLKKVPTDSQSRGYHDQNNYVPDSRVYYRNVLTLTKGDGLRFHNYIREGDPSNPWNDPKALTGGSGTDIDFTVKIVDANDDTTFIFKGEDLDVSENQKWNKPYDNDPCYDNLPITQVTYGKGGESFILKGGNDIGTVTFADKTGLVLVDNQVVATGSDPSTTWSEFIVQADAKGSAYTWVSGNACDSYALRDTPILDTGEFILQLKGEKQFVNRKGEEVSFNAGDFEFKIEKDSVTPSGAPEPELTAILPETVSNAADGTFTFSSMIFKADGENALIYDSANTPYFPGTSPNGNTSGGGHHNTENEKDTAAVPFVYTYKVTEVIPTTPDPLIEYDTTKHTVEVKFITPENDEEMIEKGIKAEIKVDGGTPVEVWSKKVSNPVKLDKLLFKNIYKVQDLTVTKKTVTEDDGDFNFTATITYNDESYQLSELPDGVTYNEQTGEYTFTLKKDKSVTLKNLPVGSKYTVTEENQDGWRLDSEENASGTIVDGEDVTATFTNRPVYDIKVEKVLEGNATESDKSFGFTVELELDGSAYEPESLPDGAQGSGGTYNFSLKGGESILFAKIPHGTIYTISESDYSRDHYVTTIDGEEKREVTGELEEAVSVTVTNTRNSYTVTYLDGDHGKSSGPNETGKHYGETPTGNNTVTPNSGYKFTGEYEYVMTLDDGTKVTGKTTNPKSIQIKGNLVFTPLYEAIVNPTPAPVPPKPTSTAKVVVPHTGDNFNVWLYAGLLGVSVVVIGLLLYLRQKEKKG